MSKGSRHKKGGKRKGKKLEAMRGDESRRQTEPVKGRPAAHREIEKGHSQKYVPPPPTNGTPSRSEVKRPDVS